MEIRHSCHAVFAAGNLLHGKCASCERPGALGEVRFPQNAQELLESALPESAQKNSLQKGGMTYAVSGGTLTVQGSGELADVASALEETGEGSAGRDYGSHRGGRNHVHREQGFCWF